MEFLVPKQVMFYCIFSKEFSKIFEIWSFMFGSFFKKFSKISRNFPKIFPTSKEVFFVPKIVQNHYINQNLAKFSLKIPKIADLSLKPLIFSKISAPLTPKIQSFLSQKLQFLEFGSFPLELGFHQ